MSANTANEQTVDEKSQEILTRMWASMTTNLGTDSNGVTRRYPRNLREVRALKNGVRQLQDLNSANADVLQQRGQYEALVAAAPQRSFQGSIMLMVLVVVAILGVALFSYFFAPAPMDVAKATRELPVAIDNAKSTLQYQKEALDRTTDSEEKAKYEKSVAGAEKRVAHLQEVTPPQYMEEYNASMYSREEIYVKLALSLGLLVLYFFSARTPYYLLLRRQGILSKWRKSLGIVGAITGGIAAYVLATPTTTTEILWSDGSRTSSDNSLDIGVLQLAFFAVLFVVLVYLLYYVMPVLIIGNLLLNYGPTLLDKIIHRSQNTPELAAV